MFIKHNMDIKNPCNDTEKHDLNVSKKPQKTGRGKKINKIIHIDPTRPLSKVGRKPNKYTPKQIKQIEKYAFNQAKDFTISAALGLDDKTFKVHFSEICQQKRAEGKLWLHQQQHAQAQSGNTAMLCFLGKNYLEQSDRQELTGRDGTPLMSGFADMIKKAVSNG